MLQGSTDFTPMDNKYGAAWQASNFGTDAPFSLQITDGDGTTLTAA